MMDRKALSQKWNKVPVIEVQHELMAPEDMTLELGDIAMAEGGYFVYIDVSNEFDGPYSLHDAMRLSDSLVAVK